MILALGLELSDKPFLWVVRPDLNNNGTHIHPDGFEASVGSRGRMVGWAPQRGGKWDHFKRRDQKKGGWTAWRRGIKASALNWKEIAMDNVKSGGASSKNFEDFVKAIKEFGTY
ncbi:hypothetical protein IFM89_026532 [Coptis chinensis]|uniref:Uncharacterized protein n=1 Tax=Coptis chinensis TaxID=261450 RepID=A0A835IYH8_9MAGN|nr:hypothetical protein IFM89_026532 [Coptis chinensis]